MNTRICYKKEIEGVKFPITKQQNAFITRLRDKNQDDYADKYELGLRNQFLNIQKQKQR